MLFSLDDSQNATEIRRSLDQFDQQIIGQRTLERKSWPEILEHHIQVEPVVSIQEWSYKVMTIFAHWGWEEFEKGGGGRKSGGVTGGWLR